MIHAILKDYNGTKNDPFSHKERRRILSSPCECILYKTEYLFMVVGPWGRASDWRDENPQPVNSSDL